MRTNSRQMLLPAIMLMLLLYSLATPATLHAATIQLPQTGQTACYNAAGATIPCTTTGQDGALQMGIAWPTPRFSNYSGATVKDNLTGLVWADDAGTPTFGTSPVCTVGAKDWQGALGYVECLNTNNYKGYNDWRLPNINELASLVNKGQSNSATWLNPQGFSNVKSDSYWSSSSDSSVTSDAWFVDMIDGKVSGIPKSFSFYVWPVRSGQSGSFGSLALPKTGQTDCYNASYTTTNCTGTGQDGELQTGADWPSPRFAANVDLSVTDNLTGLVWANDAGTPTTPECTGGTKTWQGALDYVNCLNSNSYLGKNDWRLPNVIELASLPSKGPSNSADWLNTLVFLNVRSNYDAYWSSSINSHNTLFAWGVNVYDGHVGSTDRSGNFYVWPVRAGQSGGLFGSVALSPTTTTFDSTAVGANSAATTFTISNPAIAAVTVTGISITGTDTAQFAVTAGTCSLIAAGDICTVNVTFNPTSIGVKSASLHVASNSPFTPTVDAALSGTGTVGSQTIGAITFSPTTLTVGGTTTASATTSSGLAVIFSSQTTNVCTVSGSVVTGVSSGTCIIAADQDGNANYSSAAQVTQDIIIPPVPVNGSCGTSHTQLLTIAPTADLCATGNASAVSGTGPWNWTCSGSNGGTSASCVAYLDGKPAIQLQQTGQTSCYDASGTIIPCAGTGQDGEYRMGVAWPTPRFTLNSFTVSDNLTGLIWTQDSNLMKTRDPSFDQDIALGGSANDGLVTFQHALDYINKLNNDSYLGHNDWRLPNINELESLFNEQYADNAAQLNSVFLNVSQTFFYWSSTTNAYWGTDEYSVIFKAAMFGDGIERGYFRV